MSDMASRNDLSGIELFGRIRQWYELVITILKPLPWRYILPILNCALLSIIAAALAAMIQGARYYVVAEALKDHAAYRQYAKILYKDFATLETNPKSYIAKDDARPYLTTAKNPEVTDAVFQLLNHFEHLSMLYNSGLADGTAFEDSFKDMLGTWYGRLGGWMEAYRDHCGCTFEPFEKLGKKWMPVGKFTERAIAVK